MLASKSTFIVLISAFVLCSLLLRSDEVFAGEKDSASELKLDGGFRHFKNGPKRSNIFVPDDTLHFSAILYGYSFGPDKNLKCTFTLEVFKNNGEKIIMTGPDQLNRPTGSFNRMASLINYDFYLPKKMPPGEYTLQIHAFDKISQRHVERSWPFIVLSPSTFTAYRLRLSHDPENQNFDSNFTAGDQLHVYCKLAGSLVRKEEVNFKGSITYYNKNEPNKIVGFFTMSMKLNLPKYGQVVPAVNFKASLQSPGNFVAKLEFEDLHSGKKSVHFIPFTVHEPAEFDISAFESNQIPAEAVKRKPAKRLR